jgi:hypothetical protein
MSVFYNALVVNYELLIINHDATVVMEIIGKMHKPSYQYFLIINY